eukprot:6955942-Lingulodinium_polyedra.AAC.1
MTDCRPAACWIPDDRRSGATGAAQLLGARVELRQTPRHPTGVDTPVKPEHRPHRLLRPRS